MPPRLQTAFTQFLEFWNGLSLVKRVGLAVATVAVLLGVLLVTNVSSRVEYTYLFTDLSTEDAAAISEKLKGMKVPYRIEAGGTAIQVPEAQVHGLRLELASSGLPRGGGVGFEIFDRSNMGATEFEQRVNLRRALEGELSRSIGAIDGVHSARVHLVLPETRLFAARKESSSASVVLKLRNGVDFGRREVAGIVHLVAAAVPGLGRDRVSVVSTDGVTLHRPPDGEAGGGVGSAENEQAREMGTAMEGHVRSLLERVVGPGNADVRVHVVVDKSSRERTEEHYEPTRTALRSEHKTEETTGAEGATVAGVPGAQSNLPQTEPENVPAGEGPGGSVLRRSHTRNWEVDRVTEKTILPSGGIARLSTAVVVNGSYVLKDGKAVFVPRSKEQMVQLEAIVKNAVGFDEKRGDAVRVEATQFARLGEDEAPESEPFAILAFAKRSPLVAGGVVLALLGAAGAGVFFVRRRRARKRADSALEAPSLPAVVPVAGVLAEAHGKPLAALGAPDAETLPTPAEYRAEALQIAAKDPATAAIVLKKWLNAPANPAAAA